MIKILVTAFEPFGQETINPAWEAVQRLPSKLDESLLVTAKIPTVFDEAVPALQEALSTHRPDIVLCVGQAGGRSTLGLERIAINMDDATQPDNAGCQPIDRPIVDGGPAAYFTTLPLKLMVEALRGAGLPAGVSNSAGTFVCNHLLYGLLHHIHDEEAPIKAGFIHVPYLPAQAAAKKNVPSMALEDIVRGLTVALQVAVRAG